MILSSPRSQWETQMVGSCRETGLPVFPHSAASLEIEEETLPSYSFSPSPPPFLEKTVPLDMKPMSATEKEMP